MSSEIPYYFAYKVDLGLQLLKKETPVKSHGTTCARHVPVIQLARVYRPTDFRQW